MKIGESVTIKKGVKSPDYDDLLIEGWVGRIIEIDENNLTIELDSTTLSELKEEYITDSFVNGEAFELLVLDKEEVEITTARDSKSDVILQLKKITAKYSVDEEEGRINEILKTDNNSVSVENLTKYYDYLKSNLTQPFILTGMEDFDWEEPYLLGGWDEKEYEQLKETNPSYTDFFEFIDLIEEFDDWKGIYAKVKRISDNKIFDIPLWDLKGVDETNPNFQIVSDFSSWMTNYQ